MPQAGISHSFNKFEFRLAINLARLILQTIA